MKWKSYILLFGLIVFLGETASIPYTSKEVTKKSTCKMHKGLKTGKLNDCCPRGTKKSMDCVDCPLCYLTVATTAITKVFSLPEVKKTQYRVFKNSLLSAYHNETWKPPDV